MSSLLKLWHAKHYPPRDPTDASFEGKTVLITGATAGLGFQASLKVLRQGASMLILGSRDLERGRSAKHELERRTGRTGVVQVWPLDMSSFHSVQEFAARVYREIPDQRLHIALLNAGVMHREHVLSCDGWEDTLQVNTLSTTLLALLLLPKLQEGYLSQDPTHLVIVASGTVLRVKEKDFPMSATTGAGGILQYLTSRTVGPRARKRYAISKLLIEYVARRIAEMTRNPNGRLQVIVNTVKPGFCISSLGRKYSRWYERLAAGLFTKLFARSAEAGSRVLVSAAVQGVESHGRTWQGDGYMSESGTLLTGTAGKRLQSQAWSEIIEVLKEHAPEVSYFNKIHRDEQL
ncbi:putative short-chain dehydrogenase/reductase family protein [Talaromyces proteolyticus]|uniref:Short-chain dehydrogenase/reductase family protein n=1 Tax=Talaromyces proteolyticus TaxID=1131652 RepID=A0AAD4KRK0_9EURO|nr:putative short-chain dehydrogenase/reductase family protein [Talaromyces proteolyticus]KAH8694022.1 putative short-chain dehydrogenase/reductase family protein [Talaromyces proteolyticus]